MPKTAFRPATAVAVLSLLALLSGCQTMAPARVEMPPTAQAPWPNPEPEAAPDARPSGSIFQASQYRPLFEDHRARLVGDTLNVQITEKLAATQSSKSSVDKTGSVSGSVSAFPFLKTDLLGKLAVGGKDAQGFEGKGATEHSTNFTGTITAVVTGVLPNGHLLIAGEKQIGVNSNVEVLRFTGQVDPRTIQPGNTVPSTRVANVRVEQRGRSATADANTMGWLGRVFLNVLPF